MDTFFTGLIIFFALIFIWGYYSNQREEEKKKKAALMNIASKVQDSVNRMNSAKTTKTKLKYCSHALSELHMAEQYEGYKEIFIEYDNLFRKLESMEVVLPVMDHLNKADKHRFKQKDSSEKNALLDALYEIKQGNVHDVDFVNTDLKDEETGELITIAKIEKRLKELGWEPQVKANHE